MTCGCDHKRAHTMPRALNGVERVSWVLIFFSLENLDILLIQFMNTQVFGWNPNCKSATYFLTIYIFFSIIYYFWTFYISASLLALPSTTNRFLFWAVLFYFLTREQKQKRHLEHRLHSIGWLQCVSIDHLSLAASQTEKVNEAVYSQSNAFFFCIRWRAWEQIRENVNAE